ncbi:MAG: ATPase AAA [marine actinobacterium MedAcidi-G2B]|nr:MAG: ATPase AAA [marine actinobacterium MedAcidi-G2B]MDC0245276.1 proteasome ATPase [Acidimicrobiaceae bacterium]
MTSEDVNGENIEIERLQSEVADLRRRLVDAPLQQQDLEIELRETKKEIRKAINRNEKLDKALEVTRQRVADLREEIDQLSKPPSPYGTVVGINDDGSVDILSASKKMRVNASPELISSLGIGQEVVLNEAMNVIMARRPHLLGEVATVKEVLPDGARAVVVGNNGEERVVELAGELVKQKTLRLRSGDSVMLDSRSGLLLERLPRPEVETLLLEDVPDVTYEDVGGLDLQIEKIVDAVELPFLHKQLFNEYSLPAPKGILLYGPPGCGKTLIAKAVANSLARKVADISGEKEAPSYFLNIKGPELLNMYVGETERQIRLIFERAREKSEQGWPVIVFFDEMESLFRTRGTGISSDIESTIVPQLLAEIDGVEALNNVIVIGASNREDLIDPAILRPGRLDVKIRIDRPDATAAAKIFSRYLVPELPIDSELIKKIGGGDRNKAVLGMIDETVDAMYSDKETNRFLEVTYQNGDKEVLYFRDFASGAMVENIVRRAKTLAIKRKLAGGREGIHTDDLIRSVRQEFREHEDLPNTTNPDDWAKVSGKKGERIIYVRTLVSGDEDETGGRSIDGVATGQYL